MRRYVCGALALALCSAPLYANMGTDTKAESTSQEAAAGRKAIEAQDWKSAVELLGKAAAADPNDADVRNWLGFAHRKLGNLDAAFASYNEALRLNPAHRNAHEYIGEAYLMVGDVGKAEQHLAALQTLCTPIPCEEYRELKRAVDEYRKKK
jgi:Flp pilus assembly protein TadD